MTEISVLVELTYPFKKNNYVKKKKLLAKVTRRQLQEQNINPYIIINLQFL